MTVNKVKKVCGTKVNRAKLQQVFHKLGLSLFCSKLDTICKSVHSTSVNVTKSAVLHFV